MITTGLGPVYDGVAHFALTPEDSIPVAGLAVLAGLRGPAHGRHALFVLSAFWLVGGAVELSIARPGEGFTAALSLLMIGGLVAADAPLSSWAVAAVAAVLGASHWLCRRILAAQRLQRFSHGFGNERSGICELRDRRGVFVAPAVAVGPHSHARLRELDRRERSSTVGLDASWRDSNCGSVNDRGFRKASHRGEKTMNRLANYMSTLTIPALALSMLLTATGSGRAAEADVRQMGPGEKTPENYSPYREPRTSRTGFSGARPTSIPASPPTQD